MTNKNVNHPRIILVFTNGENIYEGFIKLHFIRALRDAYPQSQIFWYANAPTVYLTTLKQTADIFLDKVFESASFTHLWKYKFDLIIDTQSIFLQSLRLKLFRHNKMVSSTARYVFSSYKPLHGVKMPKHELKKIVALASLAGKSLFLTQKPLELPSEYREKASQILPTNNKYIGLIVGAGQPFKCWPLSNFIALASTLVTKGYIPVFILGPQECNLLPVIRQEVPNALFPLQDPLFFPTHLFIVAIGERLEAAVANDCGVGHVIATSRIPLVSLFGKTNADKICPVVEKGGIIRAQDYGSDEMRAIPVDAVLKTLAQLILDFGDDHKVQHKRR